MNLRFFPEIFFLAAGFDKLMKDFPIPMKFFNLTQKKKIKKKFAWGAAAAAFQTEGAPRQDEKGLSIWDTFSHTKNRIRNNDHADMATDFYNRYPQDIDLIKRLNMNAFRFSLSWPRILPDGTGKINQKGVDFYKRVIDECLKKSIEPWITLYHWDLPQKLEDKGGWTNRDILGWFSEYTDVCTRTFGSEVKNWIILNEPMSFTGLGYFSGYHAPGRKGLRNFLPAAHHAALCQAEGGRIVRQNVKHSDVGTSFSFSHVKPLKKTALHISAAQRIDAIINRIFIEPALGLGYPTDTVPGLRKIEKYFKPGDDEKLTFDFDFYGVQYYFRVVSRFSLLPLVLFAREVTPEKRNAVVNDMGFEVFPKGLYKVLKRIWDYKGVKKIIVSECGVCFKDDFVNGAIHDKKRTDYLRNTIMYTQKAIEEGINIKGYFVWSLTDNFEWSEGYFPRFGLVYVDYNTLDRYVKDSGFWYRDFLESLKK